jgi:hypothetical protein
MQLANPARTSSHLAEHTAHWSLYTGHRHHGGMTLCMRCALAGCCCADAHVQQQACTMPKAIHTVRLLSPGPANRTVGGLTSHRQTRCTNHTLHTARCRTMQSHHLQTSKTLADMHRWRMPWHQAQTITVQQAVRCCSWHLGPAPAHGLSGHSAMPKPVALRALLQGQVEQVQNTPVICHGAVQVC